MVLAGETVVTGDLDPPGATRCRAYSSAGVSATVNNTLTLVPFGAESYDTASMHSTVTNTSRILMPVAGAYLIIAQCTWSANTSNRRAITVRKNAAGSNGGGTQIMNSSVQASSASGTQFSISDVQVFAANDYVEMFVLHNISGGGTLDVAAGEFSTSMTVILMQAT